ncbi:MAG TPA: DUF1614 domain-containing protein [Lacipirellulaceae bacterium]|nr:DUF1614 domain-containing protein [Lacipirellulaceae bacterium]
MHASSMQYFPLAWPFLLALFFIFVIVLTLVELHILRNVYERIGIPPRYVLAVLLGTLVGSAINLPVAELKPEAMVRDRVVDFFGVRYVVPVVEQWPRTIIAVNVGGALIPAIVSIYLLVKKDLFLRGSIAVLVVTLVVHELAYPVRGIGISVPTLVPPIVAAAAALLLSWRNAPPLAYIAGSLGTLIGADLLNLGKIQGLGAPVASIGGAGTFDGVFLTGIFAVILSQIAAPTPEPDEEGSADS